MINSNLLTIAYSSLPSRAGNIKFIKDVSNLVLIQNPNSDSVPRFDSEIEVIKLANIGVAKSRNSAIDNCRTKYLLFGDDDIEFKSAGLAKVIKYFEDNPGISLVLTQAEDENGKLRKLYPKSECPLRLSNSAKAATYELLIRATDISDLGIRFDENFGAGTKNYLGDEYIFIADALRAGLKGAFLPITIARHPVFSSGNLQRTKADVIARSKIFTRIFRIWAPIVRLAFLFKPPFKSFGFINLIRFIIGK